MCIRDRSNYHDGWVYQGGAFEQWFDETWTSILARDTADRYLKSATNAMEDVYKRQGLVQTRFSSLGRIVGFSYRWLSAACIGVPLKRGYR